MADKGNEDARTAHVRKWLIELPRSAKRVVLVLSDFLLLTAVLWTAMSVRYQTFYVPDDWLTAALFFLGPAITIGTFGSFGLYRLVTRFIGYRGMLRIFLCAALSMLIWAMAVFMLGQHGIPRTVILVYGVLGALAVSASRQIAGLFLQSIGITIPKLPIDMDRKLVLIYGAGQMGVELLSALRRRVYDREPVGFIDDEPSMWGQYVGGLKVYRPEKVGFFIERRDIKEVLLAIPESQRGMRRQIVQKLENYPVVVKIVPAIDEIASGKVGITDVRPLEVEDLLGREPVPPDAQLLTRVIRDKSILVTGAGGSVGSELVRQILEQSPERLVLMDISEPALYEIELEIRETIAANPGQYEDTELVAVLGSVLDERLVRHTISSYDIQTIYHAGAYKHVPIVEQNIVAGISNNTFGCAVMADAARDLGVERFVLISTDKAVRPTNVMGATKRLAELVLQAHAMDEDVNTVFTMVRFGNVLDSSGSVVRRFRQQIKQGGPLTVTHPDVIRYFMSIREAAELVIQAGSMATGGEVFVLDMGDPVKIDDLARLMIRLAGLDPRSSENPGGDIEIVYTGLRPGEKLYEELLLGANTTGTEHPRIMRSGEPWLPSNELWHELDGLKEAMKTRDLDAIRAVLMRTVEGYQPGPVLPPEADQDGEEKAWPPLSRMLH
ncbi:nucleoside-diphosphate sugar epimerase/dehydratase [Filomicrobium sp.]|uniref:polysaccharide biosynthesis protein n=1 Tax=Filomicrobium sp. TaxID=2024831 RepID=UPI002588C2E6|nr:nucleoside-diphosphate sugar epimerase/dehydratase [Filomicrobium sp.]MCV0370265.1 polysaccharide biosynthesis protein [Filomicrobium sp.]